MALQRSYSTPYPVRSSSIVELEDEGVHLLPPLKLRIKSQQSAVQRFCYDVSEASEVRQRMSVLLKFAKDFPLSTPEETDQAVRTLKDLARKDPDETIRAKAVQMIGELVKEPGVNKISVGEELVELLPKEDNPTVIVQILYALTVVGKMLPQKAEVSQKMLKLAIKKTNSPHYDVRCAGISLVSFLCPDEAMKISSGRSITAHEIFGEFSTDQDPRVRSSALQALLTLHHRGYTLDISVYEKASKALNDDNEDVRMAAVKLIWVLSHVYPERTLEHPNSEKIALVDDGFVKICNMVNDGSMQVRAEAMGLLGSLHMVSYAFLEQTLDKKLMSQMRKKKSVHEKEKERFLGETPGTSTAWNTGKTWGSAMPTSKTVDPEEVSLMNSGACGAFVRALEDEFMEVRLAAVDSLCELAYQNPAFAKVSVDFLVDMFNDEIEAVRLNSIASLIKISDSLDLREDQLDTVLNVLNDYSWEIRLTVRQLFEHCHLSTQSCLHAVVLALIQNLLRYPQDKDSVYRCMKELGSKHPYIVSSLVPELLVTHSYYAIPESSLDSPAYIATVILIFNAADNCPSICSLLPEYTKRHYDYLRDSLPHLVPELRSGDTRTGANTSKVNEDVRSFYTATVQRLQAVEGSQPEQCTIILNNCRSDLQRIAELDVTLQSNALFHIGYCDVLLLLVRIRSSRIWEAPASLSQRGNEGLEQAAVQLLSKCYRLQYAFSGLSSKDILHLRVIRTYGHILTLLMTSKSFGISKSQENKEQEVQLIQLLLDRIQKMRQLVAADHKEVESLRPLFDLQKIVEGDSFSVSSILTYLQQVLYSQPLNPLAVENRLRKAQAIINEPTGNSDKPQTFAAGLTLGIGLDCLIHNVENISDILVQVEYPDLTVQLVKPKSSDFRRLNQFKYHLRTEIVVSSHVWSDPCCIRMSIARQYESDIDESKILTTGDQKDSKTQVVRSRTVEPDNVHKGLLSLCKAVSVYIQPRAASRY